MKWCETYEGILDFNQVGTPFRELQLRARVGDTDAVIGRKTRRRRAGGHFVKTNSVLFIKGSGGRGLPREEDGAGYIGRRRVRSASWER